MQIMRAVLAAILGVVVALATTGVSATDDLPRTFTGCVAEGGTVRNIGGEITCRLIRSYDFRVYGTATDECGEEIEMEVWGESRTGVVTTFLAPGRTIVLPEVGMDEAWTAATDTPVPCRGD